MEPIPFQDFKSPFLELKTEIEEAFRKFMDSGQFVLGGETVAFEMEYANFCNSKHCVGVSNGLDALHLALKAIEIGPGDEVIVPSNTYIATWLAVSQAGAVPVPVEPLESSFNINPDLIHDKLSERTRAVLAVNLYGQPCDYSKIKSITDRHGISFLIDNAQSHGARYKGNKVGSIADIECHSFYPSKNLGAYGEAGAITTNRIEIAEKIQLYRNYGSKKRYHNEIAGYNNRIDELQAAFLRIKLRKLEEWNERRRRIAEYYTTELNDFSADLSLPRCAPWIDPVWHLFVVRHKYRDELQNYLQTKGISTLIHYPIPPHKSMAYEEISHHFKEMSLPIAEAMSETVLSLPIGPHLKDSQVERIVETVKLFKPI